MSEICRCWDIGVFQISRTLFAKYWSNTTDHNSAGNNQQVKQYMYGVLWLLEQFRCQILSWTGLKLHISIWDIFADYVFGGEHSDPLFAMNVEAVVLGLSCVRQVFRGASDSFMGRS